MACKQDEHEQIREGQAGKQGRLAVQFDICEEVVRQITVCLSESLIDA